jgi:hypothetical protein
VVVLVVVVVVVLAGGSGGGSGGASGAGGGGGDQPVGAAVPSRWGPFFLFLKTFYAEGQMGLSAHLYRGWGP